MAKFNITTAPGKIDQAQADAIENIARQPAAEPDQTVVDTPVEAIEQVTITPEDIQADPFLEVLQEDAPPPSPLVDPSVSPADVEARQQEEADQAVQRERERVEPLRSRINNFDDMKFQQDNPIGAQAKRAQSVLGQFQHDPTNPQAGLTAYAAADKFQAIKDNPNVDPYEGQVNPLTTLANQESFDAATINDAGGIDIDPTFAFVTTFAAEHFFSQGNARLDGDDFVGATDAESAIEEEPTADQSVTKAKGNARLGHTIWTEYMREKANQEGLPSDTYTIERRPPPKEHLEYMGGLAKEVYAEANPDFIQRINNPESGQVEFQPTRAGVLAMGKAYEAAGKPFDGQEVAPLVRPSATGQPQYEAQQYTKDAVTVLAPQPKDEGKGLRKINEARSNLNKMGMMVDNRAEGMLYAHGIPAARDAIQFWQQTQDLVFTDPVPEGSVYANMYNVGDKKLTSLFGEKLRLQTDAQIAQREADEAAANADWDASIKADRAKQAWEKFQDYDPQSIYKDEINKFIESLNTAARYSGKLNFNTYYVQMLTGRLGMQQNKFNPQTNKVLRFVIRQGSSKLQVDPNKQGHVQDNFKEIGAVMLLGGKLKHKDERIKLFNEADFTQFVKWGNELKGAQADPDLVAQGRELVANIQTQNRDGQNLINLGPLASSTNPGPQYSQELQNWLSDLDWEEIPYAMEYLQDLASWHDGAPFGTSFEAEMDGITHGISSNGAALGIENTMRRAGVLHVGSEKLMVEGKVQGDLRVQMKERMEETVDRIAGDYANQGNPHAALVAVAVEAVKDRPNYLKKAPMTFGYGQDLKNLDGAVKETMYTGEFGPTIQKIMADQSLDPKVVREFLHALLTDTLVDTLDPRAIQSQRQLRANNILATITGEPLYYDNAMGFRSWIGAKAPVEAEQRGKSRLKIGGKERPVYHYKEELHGAAPRHRQGGAVQPGGWGHGRVSPAIIQAYDGNMVASTFSGSHFKRAQSKAKARGHEFEALPIFDAFKTGLGNLDIVRETANRAWWEGIENKSYIEDIMGPGGWADQTLVNTRADLAQEQSVNLFTGKFQGIGNTFFSDSSKRLTAKMFESAYPYADRKYYTDVKALEADAKDRSEKLLKELNSILGDSEIEAVPPQKVIRMIETVERHLKILGTNREFSSQVKRDRKKAFEQVKKDVISQVDLG